MKRTVLRYEELQPNAPTPCFCADCMRIGGLAREQLRAKWFRSARRLLAYGKNAAARAPKDLP